MEIEFVQNFKYLLFGGYYRIFIIKSLEISDIGLYRCKVFYSGQIYLLVILDVNFIVYGRFMEVMNDQGRIYINRIGNFYIRYVYFLCYYASFDKFVELYV